MQDREDAVKEDQKDLQELQEYVGKVEKLKRQFIEQKEEIGSLNGIINDLKSQNEQLRSNSQHKTHSNIEEDQQNDTKKQKDSIKNSRKQMRETIVKGNIVRVRKQESNLDGRSNQSSFYSIKNHSGYMTQYEGNAINRMHSPQFNMRRIHEKSHWNFPTMDTVNDMRTIHHNDTKKKVVQNLLLDLKNQLSRKDLQIEQEHEKCMEAKRSLKQKNRQCQHLKQINAEIINEYEVVVRENKLMKEQLMVQTEEKARLQQKLEQLMILLRTRDLDDEKEFKRMDYIYSKFEEMSDVYGRSL